MTIQQYPDGAYPAAVRLLQSTDGNRVITDDTRPHYGIREVSGIIRVPEKSHLIY